MKKKTFTLFLLFFVWSSWVLAQETRIAPNTKVTIESGSTMDMSSGNLILESDASGDASMIDHGNLTFSGGGEATVQRYLTQGLWHMISVPVGGVQSGLFLGNYLQYHSESSNSWTDISAENVSLGLMQGYALWSTDALPTTESFSGMTNSGIISKPFSNSDLGWNLMGNPYPSSLDWVAVSKPAGLSHAIWLFDPTIGANGDYVYFINGGGASNTTSQYIPSGQGFFVNALGGSGLLTLNNTDRVHNNQSFYKSSEDDAMLVLKATGNSITTQTAIRFNSNATRKVDLEFDVFKIMSESLDVPAIFTKIQNKNMATNTLPAIKGNEVVPMWFRAGMDGEYHIQAADIETFDNHVPIYLHDIKTGNIQNLRENGTYNFNYKSGSDRSFLVYFTEPENYLYESSINIYAYQKNIHINFPVTVWLNSNFEAQIFVFDLNGRIVGQTRTNDLKNQIPVSGSNSVYTVRVVTDTKVANRKVFIK